MKTKNEKGMGGIQFGRYLRVELIAAFVATGGCENENERGKQECHPGRNLHIHHPFFIFRFHR